MDVLTLKSGIQHSSSYLVLRYFLLSCYPVTTVPNFHKQTSTKCFTKAGAIQNENIS